MTRKLLQQALADFEMLRFKDNATMKAIRDELAKPDQAPMHEAMRTLYEVGHGHARTAQPDWHDAPTTPGIWICDEGDICYTWTAHNIEILDQFDPGEGLRWYGPISEGKP